MDLWIKLTSNHPRVIIIAVRWKTINHVNIKLIVPRILWDFRPANCSPSWVRFRSSLIFSMWTRKNMKKKPSKQLASPSIIPIPSMNFAEQKIHSVFCADTWLKKSKRNIIFVVIFVFEIIVLFQESAEDFPRKSLNSHSDS